MPPELEGSQSGLDPYIWALGGDLYSQRCLSLRLKMFAADATPLDRPWIRNKGITSRGELLHWAEIHRPEQLTEARHAMEALFGSKVFLETYVRVKGGWADSDTALRQLGYL